MHDRSMAALMGLHPRLGRHSPLNWLDDNSVSMVASPPLSAREYLLSGPRTRYLCSKLAPSLSRARAVLVPTRERSLTTVDCTMSRFSKKPAVSKSLPGV